MIAKAAHDIGLDRVTMKAVADELGVSVPGLYHHVEGRDDLMRLAAEYSAAQIQLPVDHGQHWSAWLLEWARYSHDAFVAQPALLGQFLTGSLGIDRMVTHVDAVLGVLTRQGFTALEALDAYALVSQSAVGAAVSEIREAEATRAGRPAVAEYHRALSQHDPDELPHLRALVTGPAGTAPLARRQHRDRARRHRSTARRTVGAVARAHDGRRGSEPVTGRATASLTVDDGAASLRLIACGSVPR